MILRPWTATHPPLEGLRVERRYRDRPPTTTRRSARHRSGKGRPPQTQSHGHARHAASSPADARARTRPGIARFAYRFASTACVGTLRQHPVRTNPRNRCPKPLSQATLAFIRCELRRPGARTARLVRRRSTVRKPGRAGRQHRFEALLSPGSERALPGLGATAFVLATVRAGLSHWRRATRCRTQRVDYRIGDRRMSRACSPRSVLDGLSPPWRASSGSWSAGCEAQGESPRAARSIRAATGEGKTGRANIA